MFKKRQEIEGIVVRYKQELRRLGIKVKKVILYGSYARGNAKEYSDIDLIVISEDFRGRNLRERLEILGLAAGRVFEPIEALGYTSKEIQSKDRETFVGGILNSASVAV